MVHNLEVEGDNTYVAAGFAVHNCAMCMGMDGTLHSLDEDLSDHPCGRCAPLPVTKPWSDILGPLGIDASDLEETSIGAPGAYETGEEKFARMSPERQQQIIGSKTGYEAYQRGEVSLRDFVGVRPGSDGFPSQYYQRSLKEMQIPTRQAGRLVELNPELMAKYRAGRLRASDLGAVTPDELMPAWAKQSLASRNVYQILRNGLPYNMTAHEQGLLVVNLEQMLKGELPINVRAAVERQLQALGQQVERTTVGAAAKNVERQTFEAVVGETSRMPADVHTAHQVDTWLSNRYTHIEFNLAAHNGIYDMEFTKSLDPVELLKEAGPRVMTNDAAQTIGQLFDRLAQEYPAALKDLEYVGLQEGITPEMAARWGIAPGGGFAEAGPKGQFLVLSNRWRDLTELESRIATANAGYTLEGEGTPTGILTHEFGHLVENAIRNLPPERRAAYDAWLEKYPFIESNVSQYARHTAEEHFAENFAALQFGSPEIRALPEVQDFEAMLRATGMERQLQALGQSVERQTAGAAARDAAAEAGAKSASKESLDALAQAQSRVDELQRQWEINKTAAPTSGPFAGVVNTPEGTDRALWELARAQARVDAEQGGRGVVVFAEAGFRESPFAARAALDDEMRAAFGRVLSNDELGGLVGAPPGSFVKFSGDAEEGWIIQLRAPNWNPLDDRGASFLQADYSADRYLLPRERGSYIMNNQGFSIRDGFREKGLGAQIFSDEADQLSRLGNVKWIETDHAAGSGEGELGVKASGDNGYYTWPRFGYTGKLDSYQLDSIREAVDNGDLPAKFGKYTTIQQLMRSPEGRAWWQAFGSDLYDLRFDLRPGSYSMRVLKAYLASRGIG